MPSITDTAICVRHWDYSETSQTVSLFTRKHGVVRGLAKGAKREKGRFSGGIDLLDRGEVVAIIKPGRDLATLTDWTLQHIYWSVRRNLLAHRAGLYCADLVHRLVTDHDPHPELFDAMDVALRALDDSAGLERTVLAFQWRSLVETGYRPQFDEALRDASAETLAFNPNEGRVMTDNGNGDRWRVRKETIQTLSDVAENRRERSQTAHSLHRANLLLAAYIRHLMNDEPASMTLLFPDLRNL